MKKKPEGFTLIEVMVALAIFAVAMGALMSAMQSNVRNLDSLKNRTLAHWIASNKMVGFHATRNYPSKRESIEKINYGGVGKDREWVIRSMVVDTMDKNIKALQISVGEQAGKDVNYYATVDGYFSVDR
ncbi:MAG TPA: type II secretion system minor pseudopilin GspI [Dongiaceae bacterium]|nr:type II secretion system minor pseudopilin GspI [Dongiaceae bacterium]